MRKDAVKLYPDKKTARSRVGLNRSGEADLV
jgi:hypothetical protein